VLDLGLIIWDELEAEKTADNRSTSGPYHGETGLIELQPCPCCDGLTCTGRPLN
jgi:hypothetical protein